MLTNNKWRLSLLAVAILGVFITYTSLAEYPRDSVAYPGHLGGTVAWRHDGAVMLAELTDSPTIPIIAGKNLVYLEKYTNISNTRTQYRDSYCLTALALEDAHLVCKSILKHKDEPLQVKGMWAANDLVVIWGYVGSFKDLEYFITLVDQEGYIQKQYSVQKFWGCTAVDAKTNSVVFQQSRDDEEPYQELKTPVIHVLDLFTGKEIFSHQAEDPVLDIVCDNDGGMYVYYRPLNPETDQGRLHSYIEKHSIKPWNLLWTKKNILSDEKRKPFILKYDQGELTCTVKVHPTVQTPPMLPLAVLDPNNGEMTKSKRKWNPYRSEKRIGYRLYAIAKADKEEKIVVGVPNWYRGSVYEQIMVDFTSRQNHDYIGKDLKYMKSIHGYPSEVRENEWIYRFDKIDGGSGAAWRFELKKGKITGFEKIEWGQRPESKRN